MSKSSLGLLAAGISLASLLAGCGRDAPSAELWLTHPAGSARFERQQTPLRFRATAPAGATTIELDAGQRFQSMDGFGFTLTGGSAALLMAMTPPARDAVLRELFASGGMNLGVSYLRISIGASDLDDHVCTYDDLPAGQTDPELARFDLAPDRTNLIPVLRQVLALDPALKLLGSPWSAPSWMKTNRDSRGGSLKREWFGAYARYPVRYLQAMRAEGIAIDAITVQNEPLNPDNNPSMFMSAADQTEFIKRHLGPAFRAAGLTTKIIGYDHNADHPDYPLTILGDPEAKSFVDGSAFHLYAGQIDALSRVHDAHPDRNLYFTEQWIGAPGHLGGDLAWHVGELIIGATRNWCRTVLEWNLAADPQNRPHTDRGGCDRCLGAVTLDGDKVMRNPAYYVIAHAAKFVRPGSVRIASTAYASLPNVAFQTASGRFVVIVLNRERTPQAFAIRGSKGFLSTTLPGGAVGTYVW